MLGGRGRTGSSLTLSPAIVPTNRAGNVSKLTSSLRGQVSFSKLSGASTIAISTAGVVSLSTGLAADAPATFLARAQNAAGDAIERSFTLTSFMQLGVCWHASTALPAPLDDAASLARIAGMGMTYIRINIDLAGPNTAATRLTALLSAAKAAIPTVRFICILNLPEPTSAEIADPSGLFARGYNAARLFVEPFRSEPIDWELGNEISTKFGIAPGYGQTSAEFSSSLGVAWTQLLQGASGGIGDVNTIYSLSLRRLINVVTTHWGWLDYCIGNGIDYEVIDYHSYELPDVDYHNFYGGITGAYDFVTKVKSYNKPLIIGEYNDQTIYTQDTPVASGANLASLTQKLRALGIVEAALVYTLYDLPALPGAEGRFGLFHADGTPKPAAAQLNPTLADQVTAPVVPDVQKPGAPTLSATAGDGKVTIAFTDGASNGAAITQRLLYAAGTSNFTPGPGNLIGALTFPYALAGPNGTPIYLRARAVNAVGDGALSPQLSATPSAGIASLLPNAVTPPANAGTVQTLAFHDTGSFSHTIGGTLAIGGTNFAINMRDADNGFVLRLYFTGDGSQLYASAILLSGGAQTQFNQLNSHQIAAAANNPIHVVQNIDGSVDITDAGGVVFSISAGDMGTYQGDGSGGRLQGHGVALLGVDGGGTVANLIYGANVTPFTYLRVRSTYDYRPRIDLNYSHAVGGSVTGYELRIRSANGSTVLTDWAAAIITANPTAGTATIESGTAIAASQIGTYPLVDVRQTNDHSIGGTRSLYRPPAMTLGSNVALIEPYDRRRVYANVILNGYWQYSNLGADPAPHLTANGFYTSTPDSNLFRSFSRGDASGVEMEFTWDGDPNAGWATTLPEGTDTITNWHTVAPNVIRYTRNFDPATHCLMFLKCDSYDGANPPRNMDMREVGMDKSLLWAPSCINFMKNWTGYIRFMDFMNVNNAFSVVLNFAQRPRRSKRMLANYYGMCIEDMFDLCNLTGRPGWFNIPLSANANYIDGFVGAILTGAGLDDGVTLDPALGKARFEYANEIWNAGLGSFGYLRQKALDDGLQTSGADAQDGGYIGVVREQVVHYNAFATQVAQTTGWASRIRRCIGTQCGVQNMVDLQANGLNTALYEDWAVAPYWGSSAGNVGSDIATLAAAWLASVNAIQDAVIEIRDHAVADGKTLVGYEWGPDNGYSGLNKAQSQAWYRSTQMHDVFKAGLLRWKADIGGDLCQYNDNGAVDAIYAWGVEEYQDFTPAPRLDAIREVTALIAAR